MPRPRRRLDGAVQGAKVPAPPAAKRRQRTGLSRLTRYLRGRLVRVSVLAAIGILSAAAPVSALLVVQDAIDHGMRAHDRHRLGVDVAVYLGINALA